jgi:drug/metabolite transporter (DMT)-like permease
MSIPYRRSVRSALALLVTVVLWAAAFPAIRIGLRGYDPAHLVTLRFAVAAALLIVPWMVKRGKWPERADLPRIVVTGLIASTFYPLALSVGQKSVPAGTASILVSLSPVFTVILAGMFLRERVSALAIAGMTVAFGGAAVVASARGTGFDLGPGVLLVLLAAFLQGTQFVLTKSLLRRYDAFALTAFMVWAGAIGNLVFVRGLAGAIARAPIESTIAILFLGAASTVAASLTWAWALSRVPVQRAASFLYLVPPVAIGISAMILGESLTLRTLIGASATILGVAITQRARMPVATTSSPPNRGLPFAQAEIVRAARPRDSSLRSE